VVTITIDGLCAKLGRRPVLSDVSATLQPGKLIGIIGPNGAGKSTLARVMLGLVQPSGGRVLLDGRDVSAIAPRELATLVAYLPQGQTLHWPLSVDRLVALGRLPHLGPMSRISAHDRDRVRDAMARADVSQLAGRTATELSGGERARVMLARALAVGAPAMIADEPLASLDLGHQLDVMSLLANEARAGSLITVVLHDLTMAARFCDELLLMHQGRMVASGKPADVLTRATLREVYGIDARLDQIDALLTITPIGRVGVGT
jgi:iron complex transport system ATP-binding protein